MCLPDHTCTCIYVLRPNGYLHIPFCFLYAVNRSLSVWGHVVCNETFKQTLTAQHDTWIYMHRYFLILFSNNIHMSLHHTRFCHTENNDVTLSARFFFRAQLSYDPSLSFAAVYMFWLRFRHYPRQYKSPGSTRRTHLNIYNAPHMNIWKE